MPTPRRSLTPEDLALIRRAKITLPELELLFFVGGPFGGRADSAEWLHVVNVLLRKIEALEAELAEPFRQRENLAPGLDVSVS